MLTIQDLQVSAEGKTILHHFNLSVKSGEIAAVMGPNGSGKSTLAHVLAGHPSYRVEGGKIKLEKEDITELSPEERAWKGLFLAFQYPPGISGVSVAHFLRLAKNAQEKANGRPTTPLAPFLKELRKQMKLLEIPWRFAERSVNEGFSGGEKKRLEMLQMLMLQPSLIILDEVDSGLDIDAIKLVANAVNQLDRKHSTVLIITHYQRILNYITPDSVHVVKEGKVVRSGGPDLAHQLEAHGYAGF